MTAGPLAGLTVLELFCTLPGAMATQFLADAGATVVVVEPPGGSPLRATPGWPALARGKHSAVVDLSTEAGRARLHELLATADVAVNTWRPATAEALGFAPEAVASAYPTLVSASITGFGWHGPLRDLKGYEGLVMAKLGFFHIKRLLASRPGPAFVSVPFASWGAAHSAVHGILSALLERETSGLGQTVEADLTRGLHALDTWQWFLELVGLRWPDAYSVTEAFSEEGELRAPLIYPLLAAPTKDGVWLQFAQVEPRLFLAMMQEFGLADVFSDPKWAGVPVLPTQELRTELWDLMLGKVRERTLAEWQQVFETNPNVSAEIFRRGAEVMDHPQVQFEQRAVTVAGVRQPGTLAYVDDQPLRELTGPPALDSSSAGGSSFDGAAGEAPELPLAGVTILELGLMFAAPYGATVLSDLGARVVKVESLAGDTIRRIQSFPESGGAKVLQGKECISVDINTAEGREIVHALAKKATVVLQSFRAGAAERCGVDAATLLALNPGLVYLNAPGYGTAGPYGARPAYAPSIGAAGGFAMTDAANATTELTSIEEIRRSAVQLYNGTAAVPIQADGVAALGAASAMLLGVLGAARGRPVGAMTATMLGTAMLANLDQVVDYDGKPAADRVDGDYCGFHALYRMYPAAEGWVFLAAPTDREFASLVASLGLADDPRFASADGRSRHDAELAELLGAVFAGKSAGDWEALLTAADVACVEVHQGQPQRLIQADPELRAEYAVPVNGPVFDDYDRLSPLVRFSRSRTQAKSFQLAGESTDALLAEIGYSAEQIADLRSRDIVG